MAHSINFQIEAQTPTFVHGDVIDVKIKKFCLSTTYES